MLFARRTYLLCLPFGGLKIRQVFKDQVALGPELAGFVSADTVERLLTDDNLRRQVKGQVVWIDEAGLLSVKDTNRLFALASAENCRVILSGDK